MRRTLLGLVLAALTITPALAREVAVTRIDEAYMDRVFHSESEAVDTMLGGTMMLADTTKLDPGKAEKLQLSGDVVFFLAPDGVLMAWLLASGTLVDGNWALNRPGQANELCFWFVGDERICVSDETQRDGWLKEVAQGDLLQLDGPEEPLPNLTPGPDGFHLKDMAAKL